MLRLVSDNKCIFSGVPEEFKIQPVTRPESNAFRVSCTPFGSPAPGHAVRWRREDVGGNARRVRARSPTPALNADFVVYLSVSFKISRCNMQSTLGSDLR